MARHTRGFTTSLISWYQHSEERCQLSSKKRLGSSGRVCARRLLPLRCLVGRSWPRLQRRPPLPPWACVAHASGGCAAAAAPHRSLFTTRSNPGASQAAALAVLALIQRLHCDFEAPLCCPSVEEAEDYRSSDPPEEQFGAAAQRPRRAAAGSGKCSLAAFRPQAYVLISGQCARQADCQLARPCAAQWGVNSHKTGHQGGFWRCFLRDLFGRKKG